MKDPLFDRHAEVLRTNEIRTMAWEIDIRVLWGKVLQNISPARSAFALSPAWQEGDAGGRGTLRAELKRLEWETKRNEVIHLLAPASYRLHLGL